MDFEFRQGMLAGAALALFIVALAMPFESKEANAEQNYTSIYGLIPDVPTANQHKRIGSEDTTGPNYWHPTLANAGDRLHLFYLTAYGALFRLANNITHVYGKIAGGDFHTVVTSGGVIESGILCDVDGDGQITKNDYQVDLDYPQDGTMDASWNIVAVSVDPDAGGLFKKDFKLDYVKNDTFIHPMNIVSPAILTDYDIDRDGN